MYFYSGNNNIPNKGANNAQYNNSQNGTTFESKVVQNEQNDVSIKQTSNLNSNNIDKKINCSMDVLQNARRDLMGEIEAIIGYENSINTADAPISAKATWENIRDEELVHVGELLALLDYLAPYQRKYVEQGIKEFKERMSKK